MPKVVQGKATLHYLYLRCKNRAPGRGFNFTLSKTKFKELIQLNCAICNYPPVPRQNSYSKILKTGRKVYKSTPFVANTLDRIDNNKGYTVDNVQTLCDICNQAKHTLKNEDWLNWLDRIKINYQRRNHE